MSAVARVDIGTVAALVTVLYRGRLRHRSISRDAEMLLVATGAICLGVVALAVAVAG